MGSNALSEDDPKRPEALPPAARTRHRPEPERLIDVVQQLSLARDLPRVLEIVRVEARRLTGADAAAFVLREGGSSHYVDEDTIDALWKGRRFPLDACLSGWVMQYGQSVAVEDVCADSRIPADAFAGTFVRSVLMVPIRPSQPVGAIGIYWARRHRPSDAETRLLQALANSTAIAMENALLLAEMERRVSERTDDAERESAERRRAEVKLAESRRSFANLVESAMDAIVSIDGDLRIVFFNAAAEAMFRCRAADMIGRRVESLLPERLRAGQAAHVAAFLARGAGSRRADELQRLCALRANGEEFPIEAAISKVQSSRGPLASVIIRDISRRVAIEAALAASEARLRYVTEAAEVGYWDWDIPAERLEWSPRCRAIFGLSESEPLGYGRFLAALHPEDRARVDEAVRAALAGVGDYDSEFRSVHPDGSVRWVHSKGGTSFGLDGRAERMGGIALDITARKEMEAALRESERRFRTMADTAPAMLWVTDAAARRIFCSRGWYEFTGQDETTALAAGWLGAVHPEDRDGVADRFYAASGRRAPFEHEYRVRRAEGFYRWVLDSARPRLDADNRFDGFIGSVIDITDRKAAEQLMRRTALHDPLTKLPNRTLTLEFAEQLLAGGRRGKARVAVLFIDLDRFKPINDTHGHHVGDVVLAEVASRLRSCVRDEDVVGRLGGDEFIAVLSHLRGGDEAAQVAANILERLGAPYHVRRPDGSGGFELELETTPSIGISLFPDDGPDMATLIERADEAMYRAKAAGRGTFRFHARQTPPD